MKMTRIKQRLLLLLLLISLIIMPTAAWAEEGSNQSDSAYVYELLKNYHINGDTLRAGSIEEMIKSLDDPYTEYFSKEEYEAFMNSIDGTLVGIGIYLEEKDGYVSVLSPVRNSPAEVAGILAGDKIIEVNGISTKGKKMNDVITLVRGKEGTKVTLKILRENQELTFELTRTKIELPMVEYEMDQEQGIGYLHISTFGDRTFSLVKEGLDKFKEAGMKSLILDLRGNPGGRLDSVIQVASLFIDHGPILWVRNNQGEESAYNAVGGKLWDRPIALLIDKGSASASEILASALKDYKLATIIGTNSFGKGTVQTMIPLPSGNVLKLTIDEYFSAHKNKINKIGVKPDITISANDEQLMFAKEWLKGIDYLTLGMNGEFKINAHGMKSYDEFAVFQEGWYLSLYRLQSVFGGELSWDSKTNSATYSANGVSKVYKINQDQVIVKDQHLYVPVESLIGLPNVKIEKDPEGKWWIEANQ